MSSGEGAAARPVRIVLGKVEMREVPDELSAVSLPARDVMFVYQTSGLKKVAVVCVCLACLVTGARSGVIAYNN